MATSHHDREEETLIAYFQQMLAEVDDQEFDGEIQSQGSMQEVKAAQSASYSAHANQEVMQSANAAIESAHAHETVENPFGGMPHITTTDMLTSEMSMADDVEVIDNSLTRSSYQSYENTRQAQDESESYSYSSRTRGDDLDNHSAQLEPQLQPQVQLQEQSHTESLQYAETQDNDNLQRLLSTINTTEAATQEQSANTVSTVVEEPQVQTVELEKVEPVVETVVESAVEPVIETPVVETPVVVQAPVQTENVFKSPAQLAQEQMGEKVRNIANEWQNVDLGEQFQALFFLVQGVRFAVPLIDLGGIFECDKITQLFGKPDWFMGITDVRGTKINIVDTLRWVMPDVGDSPDKYPYLIALGKSHWSIGCDVLEGNRSLSSTQVKWREIPGSRPWLAGIVTSDKCALLHVNALISLFDAGAGIEDLVRDLEEKKD